MSTDTDAPNLPDPYYSDEFVTLHRGEALDVMMAMPSESVDIVVTSPPYNMGLTPGGNGRGMYGHTTSKGSRFTNDGYSEPGDDAMCPEEYAALRTAELWEMWRIARSSVWWNHRPRIIHGEVVDPLDELRRYGLDLPPVRHRIILHRPTAIDIGLTHFATRGEYLHLFAKPGFALASHSISGWGDVWPMPTVTGSDHPAPFDQSIPDRCIAAVRAASVLDPFVGSGTTLAAAKVACITGIGVERSEEFCRMAAARVGSLAHSVVGDGSLFGASA